MHWWPIPIVHGCQLAMYFPCINQQCMEKENLPLQSKQKLVDFITLSYCQEEGLNNVMAEYCNHFKQRKTCSVKSLTCSKHLYYCICKCEVFLCLNKPSETWPFDSIDQKRKFPSQFNLVYSMTLWKEGGFYFYTW